MMPNRASGPQNQPRAKVAVSRLSGASRSIRGLFFDISSDIFIAIPSSGYRIEKKRLRVRIVNIQAALLREEENIFSPTFQLHVILSD
jgi:hypothetical protein